MHDAERDILLLLSAFQPLLVPQRLSCFQRVLDSRLGFLGRQQFYKRGSLKLQEPFLIHETAGRQFTSAQDVGYLGADQVIML